ncbi:hypothetical protein ACFVTX_02465 [Agromyces sp. NPDC058136]|uniref:hypothetical protein n=1 Tax=Agromyces sp. NPDC058136 TaxID=3346354 RepID=UPI0036DA4BDA
MPGIDVIAGVAFIATFIVVSIATADSAGLEQRLRRRGSVAESAQAIRHAQEVVDFARSGYLGVVCTPSRRAMLHLGGDLDEADSPPAPPARPVEVVEVVEVVPLGPAPGVRHLAPRRFRPRRTRLARGIRAMWHAAPLSPPGERRAPATTRPPADTR